LLLLYTGTMSRITLVSFFTLPLLVLSQTLLPPLYVFYSANHLDNVVVATSKSIASLDSSYAYIDTDLQVQSNTTQTDPNTVPLNFYYNPTTKHHFTTASPQGNAYATSHGYILQNVEGWVYPANSTDSSLMPLAMYYGSARDDWFLVGTQDNKNNALAAGYVFQYIDCLVPLDWVVWPNQPPVDIPFTQSTDILDFEYAYGNNFVTPGIGADTWYPSWGMDGNYYSSWTDGTVDGHGSSSYGNGATTGYATVIGNDPSNLTLANVSTYMESAAPYQGRYPSLNFHHNGVWYYGTYSLENYEPGVVPPPDCGNWCIQGPLTEIRYSLDGTGYNWTAPRRNMTSWTDNLFGETAFNNSKVKFGAPHAVDFGQNNQYSPDGRLYIIGHGAETPASHQSWMQGDSVYLARTVGAPDYNTINDASSWEFYSGGQGPSATFSSSIADAKPLFVWMNSTGVVTMSWHPTLSKYIMVVSTPTTKPYTVYHFDTYFLESDSMTGPWSYISYLSSFGPQAYFVHCPSKFMGAISYPKTTMNEPKSKAKSIPVKMDTIRKSQPKSMNTNLVNIAQSMYEELQYNRSLITESLNTKDQEMYVNNTASYYNLYLSFSANFASGYSPNPPGSGYHWSLQQMRFSLSSAMEEKLRTRGPMSKANV